MASILVVDGRAASRDLLVSLLRQDGHLVRAAASGEEALCAVTASRPDLVITDLIMPAMGGFEFVPELGATPGVGDTPVILYAATHLGDQAAELQARLQVAERLESLGELAGRVAHDLNNLLAVILNYTQFVSGALDQLPGAGQDPRLVQMGQDLAAVGEAGRRAAELTHQLLAVGAGRSSTPRRSI
jgi:CheY-like chemotaxis protein